MIQKVILIKGNFFLNMYFVSFNVVIIKLMSTAQRRNSISEIIGFVYFLITSSVK